MAEQIAEELVDRVRQDLARLAKRPHATVTADTYKDGTYLYVRIEVNHYATSRSEMRSLFEDVSKLLREVMPRVPGEETWALAVLLRGEPIGDDFG